MNSFEKLEINKIKQVYNDIIEEDFKLEINDKCLDVDYLKNVFVDAIITTQYPSIKIVLSMGVWFSNNYSFDGRIEIEVDSKRYNFCELDHNKKDVAKAIRELYAWINSKDCKEDLELEYNLRKGK